MPLYSEHISNMYYGGAPTYTGTPYGYSGSGSSLGTSYSAPYLNPGGSYSSHSSLGSYSRTPHTSRWITSSGRNYSPMLSTISERVTSSPVRLNSPRRIPIMKRTYGTSNFTPRPININTADIDVSKNKYQSKRKSPSPVSPKISPHKISTSIEKDSSPFMPRVDGKPETGIDSSPGTQRSTIKRGRTVVRLHTIKRKERDSPRKPTDSSDSSSKNVISTVNNNPDIISTISDNVRENSPESTKWREKLSGDLIYKGKKEEKKSPGSKLVEKFILKDRNDDIVHQKSNEDNKSSVRSIDPLPDANIVKCLDRRCSLELLAEQADLLDTLIRKENLSTATLDLSKVGVVHEPKTSLETYQSIKRRKSNETNPLKTTKSDNSLHDNLTSFKNQRDCKQFSKHRSLKKSSSGGSICRLDSITEFPKEPTLMDLAAIEENRQSIKIENTKAKVKPKLKAKITSSVEISAQATSPLKFRVENVTVEEKLRTPKKEIIYSSSVEDNHSSDAELNTRNQRKYDSNIKNAVSKNVPPSPEPADGNFWDKIGKRETVYLLKRKQNIEEDKEKNRKALFWFPEEDNPTNDDIVSTCSNNASLENDNSDLVDVESVKNYTRGTDMDHEKNISSDKYVEDVKTNEFETKTLTQSVPAQQQNLLSDDNQHNELININPKAMTSYLNKDEIKNNITIPENKGNVTNMSLNISKNTNKAEDKEKQDSQTNKDGMTSTVIEKMPEASPGVLETTSLAPSKIKANSEENKCPEKSVQKINDRLDSVNKIVTITQSNETTTISIEEKTNSDNLETPINTNFKNNKQVDEVDLIKTLKENDVPEKELSHMKDDVLSMVQQNKIKTIPKSDLNDKLHESNRQTIYKSGFIDKQLVPDSIDKQEVLYCIDKQEPSNPIDAAEAPKTLEIIQEKIDVVEKCKCNKLNSSEPNNEKSNSAGLNKVVSKTPKLIKAKSKSAEKNICDESKSLKVIKINSDPVKKHIQEELKGTDVVKEKSHLPEHKSDELEISKNITEKVFSKPKEEISISAFENFDSVEKHKLGAMKLVKPRQDKKEERNMSGMKSKFENKDKKDSVCSEKKVNIVSEANKRPKIIKSNNLEICSDSQIEQSTYINTNSDDTNITSCSAIPGSDNTDCAISETPPRLEVKQSVGEITNKNSLQILTPDDASNTIPCQPFNSLSTIKSGNIPVEEMNSYNDTQHNKSGEANKADQDCKVNEQQAEEKDSTSKDIIKLPQITKRPVKEEAALRPLIATPRPLQKKVPQVIHSSSSSETSSDEDSSDDDDTEESGSSEDSTEFFECENNADGRTSTGSNDSGFDSSAPTSPASFLHIKKDCDVNCHRKCEKLTANLCGVNQRLLVEALASRPSFRKGADSPGTSSGPAPTQSDSLDLLEQELEQSTAYGLFRKTGRFTPPARSIPRFRKYVIDDFHFIKVLGKGSFGKVLLAELRDTEYYYAVKCLKKDVVLEDDDVECTLIERKVLALGTNHPYLCHLFATFQTDSHLFFVMEYLNGGDLMFHIQQSGRFPENRGRFYAAEIVSGLKFLHKRGIVYRDLKLDNILLDFDGHVRIADFGMCKLQIYLEKTADTFCGTPDYMAPEIIKGLKYNQTVDWWSFGVLLYEMLIGQSPFSGCDEDELFWSICNEMPSYPRFLSQQALTILTRLLDKDAKTRLGGTECMHGDIRDQDFFHPIHWERLERRELDAPFKPRVRHPLDTQYFDRAFTGERPRLTAVEPHVLRSMDQAPFRGFSYTNPNATDR